MRKGKIWLEKMKEVLSDINTSLLTDLDLFYLVNDSLEPNHRISKSYWEFLKSPNQEHEKSISQLEYLTEEEKEEFLRVLNVGRVKQKVELTKRAFDDKKKNAYPYLWGLERKNSHLQLKQNLSISHSPTINIQASNAIDKDIIEQLLNGNTTIDLNPKDYEVIDQQIPTYNGLSEDSHLEEPPTDHTGGQGSGQDN
ncbi:hypothetical protein [Allomuricauda sp. M10]|uniref:hypothetical protein n=1 Tax=Allomuricauda sp. M10 TaxID=2683292 RepID=UPI001D1919A0|nr:hypothetical protein [Muricauda sp. M10]